MFSSLLFFSDGGKFEMHFNLVSINNGDERRFDHLLTSNESASISNLKFNEFWVFPSFLFEFAFKNFQVCSAISSSHPNFIRYLKKILQIDFDRHVNDDGQRNKIYMKSNNTKYEYQIGCLSVVMPKQWQRFWAY